MKPKQEFYLPSSLLQDPAREDLNIILTPYQGITHVPTELGANDTATLVFVELNKCFKKAGFVAEGMLGNIIWGFEQCGYDPRYVASGLSRLRTLGYIFYTDERRNPIHETTYDHDKKKPIWIRYTEKFQALLVKPSICDTL